MTDNAMEELRALKARLAYLESLATQPEGEPMGPDDTLSSALAAHYSPDDDSAARVRSLASWGPFQPDEDMERTIAGRAAHPEAYGRPTFEESVYIEHKAVAATAKEE